MRVCLSRVSLTRVVLGLCLQLNSCCRPRAARSVFCEAFRTGTCVVCFATCWKVFELAWCTLEVCTHVLSVVFLPAALVVSLLHDAAVMVSRFA